MILKRFEFEFFALILKGVRVWRYGVSVRVRVNSSVCTVFYTYLSLPTIFFLRNIISITIDIIIGTIIGIPIMCIRNFDNRIFFALIKA